MCSTSPRVDDAATAADAGTHVHLNSRHIPHTKNNLENKTSGVVGGMQLMPPPNNGTPGAGTPVGGAEEHNSKGLMFQQLSLRDLQQVNNNTNHHHDHHQHHHYNNKNNNKNPDETTTTTRPTAGAGATTAATTTLPLISSTSQAIRELRPSLILRGSGVGTQLGLLSTNNNTNNNQNNNNVGAYNVTGVRRCHGNHQSRMSDDDSTEHVEGHHRMSDDDPTEHVEGHQLRTRV